MDLENKLLSRLRIRFGLGRLIPTKYHLIPFSEIVTRIEFVLFASNLNLLIPLSLPYQTRVSSTACCTKHRRIRSTAALFAVHGGHKPRHLFTHSMDGRRNKMLPTPVASPLPMPSLGSHPYWIQVDVTKVWPFRNRFPA
jgi:hypothetical protein